MLLMLRLLTILCLCLERSLAASLPNIVLIVADDLGWNDVSFHGSEQIPTPNIDAFANDGIILNKYYVSPLCTPSRGSLFTGKHATQLGLQHYVIVASEPWGLPLEEKTLPQYLKDSGYATRGVGKWHLGSFAQDYLPTRRGFDSFFGYWTGEKDYYNHFAESRTMYGLDLHDGEESSWQYNGYYSTDLFTDKAKTIIESHNKSQPLFLYMAYQAVHAGNSYSPLQAPPKYVKHFDCIDDPERRKFAGMVHGLDIAVGEVVASLDKSKLLDDTLLIFTTDNGGAVEGVDSSTGSNWPLRGSKYTLWEGGVRGVSFAWSSQLRKRSRVDENLFHVSDWLPTIIAAAGGDPTKLGNKDGINQWPTLSDGHPTKRKEILHNIDDVWEVASIRRGPYKLVNGSVERSLDGWFDKQGKPERNKPLPETRCKNTKNLFREAQGVKILSEKFGKVFDNLNSREHKVLVECGPRPENSTENCDPKKRACLFDVEKDPCEYNNIAHDHPQTVFELEKLLELYRERSIAPGNKPSDPSSNPKYHGYAWVPWVSH